MEWRKKGLSKGEKKASRTEKDQGQLAISKDIEYIELASGMASQNIQIMESNDPLVNIAIYEADSNLVLKEVGVNIASGFSTVRVSKGGRKWKRIVRKKNISEMIGAARGVWN